MTDDIDAIRRRKREELAEKLDDGGSGAGDGGSAVVDGGSAVDDGGSAADDGGSAADSSEADAGRADTPDEPVHVEGGQHLRSLADDHDVVLVDFHAEWCGPCRMLEPVVEDVAAETPAAVAKVDIDVHQGLAAEAGVRGVPTLVLYADGEPVERLVGMQDRATLEELVEEYAEQYA